MPPQRCDDVCTNDADKSATAFSPPKLTLQPINDELTSAKVSEFCTTISPLELHPSQTTSDDCLQELPWDSLQVERNFKDAKEESIISDVLTGTCGCKLGSGKSQCFGPISEKTITQMRIS